jgi:hypothetical protein
MKMATPPEHEFLIVKIVNSFDKKKPVARNFILEHAQGENDECDGAAPRGKGKYERIKEVASASYTAFVDSSESPKDLLLMEEGTSPSASITPPSSSTSDKITVLLTKLVDASSENNDKFQLKTFFWGRTMFIQ